MTALRTYVKKNGKLYYNNAFALLVTYFVWLIPALILGMLLVVATKSAEAILIILPVYSSGVSIMTLVRAIIALVQLSGKKKRNIACEEAQAAIDKSEALISDIGQIEKKVAALYEEFKGLNEMNEDQLRYYENALTSFAEELSIKETGRA